MSGERHDARTATFDFDGRQVEVTYLPALWRATVDGKTFESRRLDEALVEVLDSPARSSTALVRLVVDVLDWALLGQSGWTPGTQSPRKAD
jgi:hypothetical protein